MRRSTITPGRCSLQGPRCPELLAITWQNQLRVVTYPRPMRSPKLATKAYSLLMFVGVSILCGLLVAGLGMPAAALTSAATKAGASTLETLPTDLTVPPQMEGSKMVLSDGTPIATFYDQNRQYVGLDQIAPIMQKAQLAIEDHRYYQHGALDLQGLIRAAAGNVIGGDITGGGSTLTQQYVKQVRIQIAMQNGDAQAVQEAQAPTLSRKVAEMRYAVALEKNLEQQHPGQSKNIVLERYLNIAYYGDGAYGVQAAAMHYFGVNAKDLNLAQAAMLAGLVQSPGDTDPINHPDAAIARRNVVLDAIARWDQTDPGWFPGNAPVPTDQEIADAKGAGFDASKVVTMAQGCESSSLPFICDYAKRILLSDQMPSLGKTPDERMRTINQSALTIVLTIDPASQQHAQDAIAAQVAPQDPVVGAADILNPKTGDILAMAQSKPSWGDGSNNTTAWNYNVEHSMGGAEGYTAGSTFKIFTAAAAIAQGFNPDTTMLNAPVSVQWRGKQFKNCTGPYTLNEDYQTTNSSGVNGVMNMVRGMQWSVNNYFVELERQVGLCDVVKIADAAGIKLANPDPGVTLVGNYQNPSFTLGGVNTTPLSMANAYGTFANRGIRCDPRMVAAVKTKDGKDIPVPPSHCEQVIDPNVAAGVNYVLKAVMTGGLSAPARIPGSYDEASKTGTTGDAHTETAVWFAGYTPEVAGVAMVAIDPGNPFWINRQPFTLTGLKMANGRYFAASSISDTGMMWKQMMTPELARVPDTKFDNYVRPTGRPSNYTPASTPTPTPTATPPNSQNTQSPGGPKPRNIVLPTLGGGQIFPTDLPGAPTGR